MSELPKALPTAEQAEPLRPGEVDPSVHHAEASKAETESVQPEAAAAEQAEQLAEAREAIAAEAEPSLDPLEQLQAEQNSADAAGAVPAASLSRETRRLTAQRELSRLQRRLPTPERILSKVIHQHTVQAVSEAAGKTVTRPSGLLGGGLVAFLGSGSYLYLAKHVGFKYNYFVSTLLFIIGFGIGLALELAVWVATRSRRESD